MAGHFGEGTCVRTACRAAAPGAGHRRTALIDRDAPIRIVEMFGNPEGFEVLRIWNGYRRRTGVRAGPWQI